MCKAFSCLITKSKKVYWKLGIDSHDELQDMFVKEDKELKDDKEPPNNTFARIEIVPRNGDYLTPKQEWIYQIDEKVKPNFLTDAYEKICRKEWEKWFKEAYLIDANLKTLPKNKFIYVINSKIEYLSNQQFISVLASSQVGKMWGSSQVGEMWGSSQVGEMCNQTTVTQWSKDAKVEKLKEDGVIIVRYEKKVRVILSNEGGERRGLRINEQI